MATAHFTVREADRQDANGRTHTTVLITHLGERIGLDWRQAGLLCEALVVYLTDLQRADLSERLLEDQRRWGSPYPKAWAREAGAG